MLASLVRGWRDRKRRVAARRCIRGAAITQRELGRRWSRSDGAGLDRRHDIADSGGRPFHELLMRIGERAKTEDRRTIAASFALRFGWTSAMAIAPYLRCGCVPDIASRTSRQFKRDVPRADRDARPARRGAAGIPVSAHPSMATVADARHCCRAAARARRAGRRGVEALFAWSGFARKGTWGQRTSSWASHVTTRARTAAITVASCRSSPGYRGRRRCGPDAAALPQVRYRDASICFNVAPLLPLLLLPNGELCASCPLVSHETVSRRTLPG